MITDHMKRHSDINILPWTLPYQIDQNDEGRLSVKHRNQKDHSESRDGIYYKRPF